ncbi:hypothetical protein [Intestinibacter sp.]
MQYNNLYNFRNTIRHFVNISNLLYPNDLSTFSINDLCWTRPISFRIRKDDNLYRTIKIPNILSFVRAYHYYKELPNFDNTHLLDEEHKRLFANITTGDFSAGTYDNQLNEDFSNLCIYDYLLRLDISEYYDRIYTHNLDLDSQSLEDRVLAGLNFGRTGGILMGNYISLYFAEYILSKISSDIEKKLIDLNVDCTFNYFSDDFYFFCNESDKEQIINIFDSVLEKHDFRRKKEKLLLWDYEKYNSYNMLTRYWKATVRHWNLEILKDSNKQSSDNIPHKLTFLNQLIYRASSLDDNKSKRTYINNFFKTKHFQNTDFNEYIIRKYDYHQLCYLLKTAPESLLYISHKFNNMSSFEKSYIKKFLTSRYKETLHKSLNDEQLYYYYSLKCFGFDEVLNEYSSLVLESQNQILISYYLIDGLFNLNQIDKLKLNTDEEYWFQNYHLILTSTDLYSDLSNSIENYLLPQMSIGKINKEKRYMDFYKDNLQAGHKLIFSINEVTNNIKNYLDYRYEEVSTDFDEEDEE